MNKPVSDHGAQVGKEVMTLGALIRAPVLLLLILRGKVMDTKVRPLLRNSSWAPIALTCFLVKVVRLRSAGSAVSMGTLVKTAQSCVSLGLREVA